MLGEVRDDAAAMATLMGPIVGNLEATGTRPAV